MPTSLQRPCYIPTTRIKLLHWMGGPCSEPTQQDSGKRRACVNVNDAWWSNTVKLYRQCLLIVESLMLRCQLHFQPWEFTSVFVVAVYIPLNENEKNKQKSTTTLYEINSSYMTNSTSMHILSYFSAFFCLLTPKVLKCEQMKLQQPYRIIKCSEMLPLRIAASVLRNIYLQYYHTVYH